MEFFYYIEFFEGQPTIDSKETQMSNANKFPTKYYANDWAHFLIWEYNR